MSKPILVQGAMDVEVATLVGAMTEVEEKIISGFSFWTGKLGRQDMVVSKTNIGTIHATCATTLGVFAFQPQVVINQGIAGGHRESLHVGDIVVGESCIHIADLITPERGKGEGSHPETWYIHQWRELADGEHYHWNGDLTWVGKLMQTPYTTGKKIAGRLGSGDIFNREYDRILQVQAQCNQDCEDMESIAVYQTSKALGVPCVGVRIISNNELTGEQYQPQVAEILQRFLIQVLKG